MRVAKSLAVGSFLALALTACGSGGSDNGSSSSGNANGNNGTGAGSTSSSSTSGGGVERGEVGGACLPPPVKCNLGGVPQGNPCVCVADPDQGKENHGPFPDGSCRTASDGTPLVVSNGLCTRPPMGTSSTGGSSGQPVGSQGGPCTAGGSCDSGLRCTQRTLHPPGLCDIDPMASSSSSSSSGGGGTGSSSGGSSSGGGTTARQLFDANVSSLIGSACAICHKTAGAAQDFTGTGPATYYQTITTYQLTTPLTGTFIVYDPNSSLLVTKGAHTGRAFTAAEKATVVQWLDKERIERNIPAPSGGSSSGGMSSGGIGGGPVVSANAAILGYGNCLSRTDFDATNYNNVADQNSNQGRCYSCHATGAGGAFLSQNADDTYTYTKISPYLLKVALPSQKADGTYSMVASNRLRDKGAEPGTHAKYVLSAAREQAVEQLFSRTLVRFTANTANCRSVGSGP